MRKRLLSIAIVAAGTCISPHAQEGSWGDGHAAIYNTPMGYSAPVDYSGPPKGRRPSERARQPEVRIGFTSACINGGEASVPPEDETHGYLRYPCPDAAPPKPSNSGLPATALTVVTTGAWNTSIVEFKRNAAVNPPLALNGGLRLD